MTTDERVIAQLAEANPMPSSASPTGHERAEAERILGRILDEPPERRPRRRPPVGVLAPVISLLVVVVVAAAVLRTGGSSTSGSTPRGGLRIALSALPTPQVARIPGGAMSREIAIMRRRLASVGRGFTVTRTGATGIVVTAAKAHAAESARVVRLVTQPARLHVYDWEANALTPTGRTVASQLRIQDQTALEISQGGGATAPGTPGAGTMSLYDAVTLAAKQRVAPQRQGLSRTGPEFYMFGTPGSSACVAAAKQWGVARPISGSHCLLSGPLELGPVSRQRARDALAAQVPPGVTASQGQVLAVPQGIVVVQAEQLHPAAPVPVFSPAAQFFVLKDHVALTGSDITNPQPSTDTTGSPDVTFGFNGKGESAFQRVTGQIAHRGASVSVGATTLYQHFAVALDNQLVTVPQIDFRQYPDGIIGGGGADITGGFTSQTAQDLATELRDGALPLNVRVVR